MSVRNRRQTLFQSLFFVLLVSSTAFAAKMHNGPVDRPAHSEIRNLIFATVEKVESDTVLFRTEDGTVRDFGVKEAKREGLQKFRAGEWVTLEVNDQNSIVEIHQAAVGTVQTVDPEKRRIQIQTGPMKSRTYSLGEAAFDKLAHAKNGAKVKLELDPHNRVIDAMLGS